jgi:hypothetical protein
MAVKRESAIDFVRRQQRGWLERENFRKPSLAVYGRNAPRLLTDRQRGAVSPLGGQAVRSQGRRRS